jgi:hypothetical protein
MSMGRRWAWLATLTLGVLALAVTACTGPIDEAGARKAATDYYMAYDHEGDNPPVDVVITSVTSSTREAKGGWDVAISGKIVLPGLPDGYLSGMILFVDGSSGAVTVVSQG